MRFTIPDTKENIVNFMRNCGYQFEEEHPGTGEVSFMRRIIAGDYPKFHIYARFSDAHTEWELNLHLDQKQPSYEGTVAHGGEYEGAIITSEAERIREFTRPVQEESTEGFSDHETMFGV